MPKLVDCPWCGEPADKRDIHPFLKDGRFPMCLTCTDATMFLYNIHTMTYGKPEDEFIRALEAKVQEVEEAHEESPPDAQQNPRHQRYV